MLLSISLVQPECHILHEPANLVRWKFQISLEIFHAVQKSFLMLYLLYPPTSLTYQILMRAMSWYGKMKRNRHIGTSLDIPHKFDTFSIQGKNFIEDLEPILKLPNHGLLKVFS